MGIVVLLVALMFTRARLPEITSEPEAADAKAEPLPPTVRQRLKRLSANRFYLFGVLALFSYEVAEIGINSFFINYVTDYGYMNARDASIALSFGGLGLFMLGRVAGSFIMQHVSSDRVLRICALGTFATTLVVMFNWGIISLAALVFIYVFESIMFPTVFALSLRGLGGLTKLGASFLMMTPIGGAIGPLFMGLVADSAGMAASFIVPLVGFAIVGAYAFANKQN